jgi:hypothetical protein
MRAWLAETSRNIEDNIRGASDFEEDIPDTDPASYGRALEPEPEN